MTSDSPRPPPRRRFFGGFGRRELQGLFWQVLVVGIVLAVVAFLWSQHRHQSLRPPHHDRLRFPRPRSRHADRRQPARLQSERHATCWAFVVGIANTLRVAVIGIVLATILGTLIGIARLSTNWLLSRLAAVYVETLRDIPLLLQLLFWYVLMQALPAARAALAAGRGRVPVQSRPDPAGDSGRVAAALGARRRRARACRVLSASAMADRAADARRQAAAGLAVCGWARSSRCRRRCRVALGVSWTIEWPELRGFNFVGGLTLAPEYFALLIALVTYTSAFIAEIVRSGIQSVPRGQWDAASALGLRRSFMLRQIVLPQALRVIVPPMTSQYLNLTKNSSLAVAIGYQDIVSIANTTLNQTGQAIEAIALIMAVFLTISLGISFFMNWYNARIALVER